MIECFYQPENHEIEISTHNSIRNLLFNQTLKKIKKIEFFHLRNSSNYFELKHIIKKEYKKSFFDKFNELTFKKNLINTLDWVFERNKVSIIYKV